MHRPPSPARSASTGYYGDSRCRSIWQWQLILAFTVVSIAFGVAALTPAQFGNPLFSAGMVALTVTTVVSLAIPWHLIGSTGVLVLPVVDTLAIGMLQSASATALAFLWVIPVCWVAAYYSPVLLAGMIVLIAALQSGAMLLEGVTVDASMSIMVIVITLSFLGVTMLVGSERNRSVRGLLAAQSERLVHALQRVKDARARNERALNSLDIGIARVDSGGSIEVTNNAFRRLFSTDDAAHYYPTGAVEYRTRRGEPVPTAQTVLSRASRGELFEGHQTWLFGLDGQWRAVRATTRLVEQGQVTGDGVLLIIEEITESVHRPAAEDATRREISHELRNPLTAILGHIDLMLDRTDVPDAMRSQLEVVERAGSRMEKLINDALTPRSAEAGAAVDFDLVELARASVEAFAATADIGGVSLNSQLDGHLPVTGDAFRMRQVIDNVVGNGVKYAQRGGTVTVRSERRTDAEIAITVSDTGIGIGADDLPRIFERDFRTALAREQGIPGTGLGLNISKDIVAEHGGRFEVSSELGQGTRVSVVLPTSHPAQERYPE